MIFALKNAKKATTKTPKKHQKNAEIRQKKHKKTQDKTPKTTETNAEKRRNTPKTPKKH